VKNHPPPCNYWPTDHHLGIPFPSLPPFSLLTLFYNSRNSLSLIFQIISSPFGHVGFLEVFFTDVLTSAIKSFADVEYLVCFYATGDWLYDGGW